MAKQKTVRAEDIPTWAGYFRRPAGTYVYLRISKGSIKFHGMNTRLGDCKVYGACFNGNIAAFDPSDPVVRCDVFDMARNVYDSFRPQFLNERG